MGTSMILLRNFKKKKRWNIVKTGAGTVRRLVQRDRSPGQVQLCRVW